MKLEKLTRKNWFPIKNRVPVFAEHLNKVIEAVNNITDGGSEFDNLSEMTAGHGIVFNSVPKTDSIAEKTSGAGVTVDGVILKDGQVKTDYVVEKTAGTGVNIDSVLLKDGGIHTEDGSVANPVIHGTFDNSGIHFDSAIVGFSTAGTHSAELVGDGSFQVKTTVNTGGFKAASGEVTPLIAVAVQEEIVANDAVSVANFLTTIDSTSGALALTLGSGIVGQMKKLLLRVAGGAVDVTGNFAGAATTLTLTNAGEFAVIMWNGTEWIALELGSVLNMAHVPVIA